MIRRTGGGAFASAEEYFDWWVSKQSVKVYKEKQRQLQSFEKCEKFYLELNASTMASGYMVIMQQRELTIRHSSILFVSLHLTLTVHAIAECFI